ncbi:MAG: enoyl-CoA hydratase-related protein, partial [Pseudomonadota bacterium]
MNLTQLLYEITDGVAMVTINRPEKLNAFTPIMVREMLEVFKEADRDDSVRVVVVTGAGRAFCAGAEMSSGKVSFDRSIQEGRKVSLSEHRDGGGRVSLAIFQCRKPVIAAINGHAVGVG